MVSTVMTDHTRSYMSTRGLEGRSSERGAMTDTSLYMIGWGAGSQCMIGWGAGPCYVILREDGFLQMSGWSGWPMLEFQMSSRIAGTKKESRFVTTLICLSGD